MEQLEKNECPICKSKNLNLFFEVKDYMITQESFNVVECGGCGFKFTNPIPSPDKIGRYYESEVYVSHSNTKSGLKNFVYHLVRNFTLRRKVDLAKRYAKGNSLLDIGSGAGYFLNAAKEAGFNTLGLEPSVDVRDGSISNFGLEVKDIEHLHKMNSKSVDVVSMWHVLEHVYDLNVDVKKIVEILKDEGVLIVAVPNPDSWDAKHYGPIWGGWDVPRHLYHFREIDIKNLFDNYGMEIVEVKPMQFDPVYVSMLSEQYKGRSVLHAVWNGMRSYFNKNRYGCTSQIYILKKKSN